MIILTPAGAGLNPLPPLPTRRSPRTITPRALLGSWRDRTSRHAALTLGGAFGGVDRVACLQRCPQGSERLETGHEGQTTG